MEISKNKTNKIIIRAFSNYKEDYNTDICQFAIISISNEWEQKQRNRIKAIEHLCLDEDFYKISFDDSNVVFFENSHIFNINELLENKQDWAFIQIEKQEYEELLKTQVDSKIIYSKIELYKDGLFEFVSTDKYYDEYITNAIHINNILNN